MNMPVATIKRNHTNSPSIAHKPNMQVVNGPSQKLNDLGLNYLNATKMLDQHFPLQEGSHKDVKQYVIYFRHILAFFEDGSHCGLSHSKQFVAYGGFKEDPDCIVFKSGSVHIAVHVHDYCSNNQNNLKNKHIRLEYPVQESFIAPNGEDYFVD